MEESRFHRWNFCLTRSSFRLRIWYDIINRNWYFNNLKIVSFRRMSFLKCSWLFFQLKAFLNFTTSETSIDHNGFTSSTWLLFHLISGVIRNSIHFPQISQSNPGKCLDVDHLTLPSSALKNWLLELWINLQFGFVWRLFFFFLENSFFCIAGRILYY